MDQTARNVIAANLKALMTSRPKLNTFAKITKAGGPSNGTLDRIRRAKSGCSLDQLDLLGDVFNLHPWQFLVPGLAHGEEAIRPAPEGDPELFQDVRDMMDVPSLAQKFAALRSELAEVRTMAKTLNLRNASAQSGGNVSPITQDQTATEDRRRKVDRRKAFNAKLEDGGDNGL